MGKVISVMNFKGGTGKTTSVINIGTSLALKGHRTLLIDLDAQSNLSEGLNVFDPEKTLYTAFKEKTEPTPYPLKENLYIIPSNLDSVSFDFDIQRQDYKEKVFYNMLSNIIEDFDYILLDLPPSLNSITTNALVISDKIIIPLDPEFFAYRGLDKMLDIIKLVKKNSNPNLDILGVLITKYLPNRNLSSEIFTAVRDHFEGKLFKTYIRSNIKLGESQANGVSIFDLDASCNGAIDYNNLTDEILELIK